MALFGASDPYKVSYFVADRVLAQSLSVVALVAITWVVVRELPEVMVVIEVVLFMTTGTEYALQNALGNTVRAVGGERAAPDAAVGGRERGGARIGEGG